uniref:Uncharacterized protein n=1 Tax=Arundo donax TaxID=35708 RepID=A0A0A9AGW9_ARUDO
MPMSTAAISNSSSSSEDESSKNIRARELM